MSENVYPHLGRSIARCRMALSAVALVVVFVDPSDPMISQWIPIRTGAFMIDPYALGLLLVHVVYSGTLMLAYQRVTRLPGPWESMTTWVDVGFGAVIAALTEGINSPMYAFFVFAVTAAGLSVGMRRAITVTAVSVILYLSLIVVSNPGITGFYLMRPVYLGVIGYLVGYLGQERLKLEAGIRELAAANERQQIARDLHDGRAQALAGINLRLETCRELLRRGAVPQALAEVSDLQVGINREYDELRVYMRSLAGLETPARSILQICDTRFKIDVDIEGSADLIEHVMQIVREGVSNVARHASANAATITARREGDLVAVRIDDDGIGLRRQAGPWTIASLASELGGNLTIVPDERPGAHLAVTLPAT